MTQVLACGFLFISLFLLAYFMFFRNYTPHDSQTRFRAWHSRGPGMWGDSGDTYAQWEEEEKKTRERAFEERNK